MQSSSDKLAESIHILSEIELLCNNVIKIFKENGTNYWCSPQEVEIESISEKIIVEQKILKFYRWIHSDIDQRLTNITLNLDRELFSLITDMLNKSKCPLLL